MCPIAGRMFFRAFEKDLKNTYKERIILSNHMKFNEIFVFVIASKEEPAYLEMIRMRKMQFEKYQIPHAFLYDGEAHDGQDPTDFYYEKEPVAGIVHPHMNPHMIMKFMKAVRHTNLSSYRFVLRINLSTYINFPRLLSYVETLPNDHVAAGYTMHLTIPDCAMERYHTTPMHLLSGCAMIFSPDVVHHLQEYDHSATNVLHMHNDDVVLTHIVQEYGCKLIHLPMLHWWYSEWTEHAKHALLIRLKDDHDRMNDVKKWRELMRVVDEINIE
jgi:hypothetical protein